MRSGRAAVIGALTVTWAACGSDAAVEAMYVESDYGVPVATAREVYFLTTCAEDVGASLTETEDEVRISDIEGDALGDGRDGPDCQGGVTLSLAEPIGDRAVVVDGETWVLQRGSGCPDGRFAPPESNVTRDCERVP
jgi:hypothetical protein